MAGDTNVEIEINVEDNSSTEIENITNNVYHLHQAVQREQQEENRWSKSLQRIRDRALAGAKAVARVGATVSAVAAAAGPAASGLLALGKAVATIGKASTRLTPLVAFLPSLAGAFALISTTLKMAAPGLARAFEPITRQFRDAKGEATALAKTLERVVGIDVKPAAAQFVKVNFPAIAHAMERIAYQTNLVIAGTLKWANSAQGVAAIKAIATSTADAFTALVPHVLRLVTAFGNLAGKAGGRAITGIGDAIGRLMDKISTWAEQHDLDDINRALKDLSGYGLKIRQAFTAVRDVGRWLAENEGAVKHFSDVAAGAAVALGVATGNVPAVVAGAVSLIINHWNDLKGVFASSGPWLGNVLERWKRDAGRIALTESIMRALTAFRTAFMNVIEGIGPKFIEFISRLKAAWEEWAPLITAWWNTGGKQIFQVAGVAIGGFVLLMLDAATKTAQVAQAMAAAFKLAVNVILGALGTIINGAAKAFGWVPGLGAKLNQAAAEFEAFKNSVNRALNGIDSMKTITISGKVYITGGGNSSQSDQRTGNSRGSDFSGLTSWMRAAQHFMDDRTGTNRTGGPTAVTATVQNTIMLDGRPFRQYTDRALLESESRIAWRTANARP